MTPESPDTRRPSWSGTILGPVAVTATLTVLSVVATGWMVTGVGWVLTWLLLGLTAGYALSGSV